MNESVSKASSTTKAKRGSLWLVWPPTGSDQGISRAIQAGTVAAFLVVAVTAIPVILSLAKQAPTSFSYASYIRAGIYAVVGIGIYNKFRLAAVAGLALFCYEIFYVYSLGKNPFSVFSGFMLLYFVHGVRGTFAAHRALSARTKLDAQPTVQPDDPASGGPAG